MIDHTLDPLPRRTPSSSTQVHGERPWFSGDTMNRAWHYDDVTWPRLVLPVLASLVLGMAGLLTAPGALSAVMLLAGLVGVGINLPALILKAAFTPRR